MDGNPLKYYSYIVNYKSTCEIYLFTSTFNSTVGNYRKLLHLLAIIAVLIVVAND